MYFIIYTSQAHGTPGETEFRSLLEQCQVNNSRRGITGLLLYHNGQYLQVIEGEKQNILTLYDIISRDNRHQHVRTLAEGEQEGRNFPDWAMGFKAVNHEKAYTQPAFINLNENELIFNADTPNPHPALPHLKSFYQQLHTGQEFIQL